MVRAAIIGLALCVAAVGVSEAQERLSVQIGGWSLTGSKSALDGKASAAAISTSTNTVINVLGQADKAELSLHCSGDGRIGVMHRWPNLISRRREVDIRYKVDDGPVRSETQITGSDATAALFPTGARSERLWAEMAGGSKFVLQAGVYEGVFDITGASEVTARMRDFCGLGASPPK